MFSTIMVMQQTPDITVVIPVYNSGCSLARAVISVTSQTYANIEILIIDDGSTDDSLTVARKLAASDPRIAVVAQTQNGGKARAMNYAANIARGQWLAVLDADDCYLPQRLAVLLEAGNSSGVDLVADNQLHIDSATGQVIHEAFTASGSGRAVGLTDFINHSDPSASFDFGILKPMIRADFIRRHQLAYHPDAKLAEDYYFLLDFFTAGGEAWLVHKALYKWTLPFSPTARRWTTTGAGAWRYDYRNALQTNRHFQEKLGDTVKPAVVALLRRREREYRAMVFYIDAQRVLAEGGGLVDALVIIATHPSTWWLLIRRLAGRMLRAVRNRPTIGHH